MEGIVELTSDNVKIIASGSFIPFKRKNNEQKIHLRYDDISIKISLFFKESKIYEKDKDGKTSTELKRYYSPEWEHNNDNIPTNLKLTFFNTPLFSDPGGPIEPIKLGVFEEKTLHFRIRTFGSNSENMVIFYCFYMEGGSNVDE